MQSLYYRCCHCFNQRLVLIEHDICTPFRFIKRMPGRIFDVDIAQDPDAMPFCRSIPLTLRSLLIAPAFYTMASGQSYTVECVSSVRASVRSVPVEPPCCLLSDGALMKSSAISIPFASSCLRECFYESSQRQRNPVQIKSHRSPKQERARASLATGPRDHL